MQDFNFGGIDMKWTYDWLTDYLDTNLSPEQIADELTRVGLEVEELVTPVAPIAARIVECVAHENSDHLHVLKVDDGSGTLRQVVCGAPNARVGLVSALAVPGCIIDGHEITSGKLRGVISDGMMCSGKELGISDDHSGIIELDENTKIGSSVLDVKTIFDAGITPNRPDYLSVRGIARDLSAAGAGKYIVPIDNKFKTVSGTRRVVIKTDKCATYKLLEISNLQMTKSCEKIASRLRAIGINPKNAAIDATNYICYDMAQPMHCFDADEIHGDIVVRMATPGEKFTDLFGTEHELTDADMVIADDMGILALAGVIGGARGATTDSTKNIILESAYFDPVSVRKSAKRIGMSTDASYRYERGIDPTITGIAVMKAAEIIMDRCGGKITNAYIAGSDIIPEVKINYNPKIFAKKTGAEMDEKIQRDILEKLGYTLETKGDKWILTPPSRRVDVNIPETVVADLLRIYGYEKLALVAVHTIGDVDKKYNHELYLKEHMASRGLNECCSYAFGNSIVEKMLSDKPVVKIANPITTDMDTARNSLLGGLLQTVSNNEKRGYPDLNLFELGTVFDGDAPRQQHTSLCIVRTGCTGPKHWQSRTREVDIYDVKNDIISMLNGQKFTVSTENVPNWAHPYRYGKVVQGKRVLAEFGELHPSIAKQLRIKTNVVIAIVDDVNSMPKKRIGKNITLSEFQPISRDFAFVVDSDMPAEKLTGAAMAADARITDVVVFDAFDLSDGKKSIAFTITIAPRENMSDTDLLKIQDLVIKSVEKKCDAKIRDK